jgi:hypothetical protein
MEVADVQCLRPTWLAQVNALWEKNKHILCLFSFRRKNELEGGAGGGEVGFPPFSESFFVSVVESLFVSVVDSTIKCLHLFFESCSCYFQDESQLQDQRFENWFKKREFDRAFNKRLINIDSQWVVVTLPAQHKSIRNLSPNFCNRKTNPSPSWGVIKSHSSKFMLHFLKERRALSFSKSVSSSDDINLNPFTQVSSYRWTCWLFFLQVGHHSCTTPPPPLQYVQLSCG